MAAGVFLRVHTTESISAPNEDDDFGLITMPCNVIRNSLWSEFFQHILTSRFLSSCFLVAVELEFGKLRRSAVLEAFSMQGRLG